MGDEDSSTLLSPTRLQPLETKPSPIIPKIDSRDAEGIAASRQQYTRSLSRESILQSNSRQMNSFPAFQKPAPGSLSAHACSFQMPCIASLSKQDTRSTSWECDFWNPRRPRWYLYDPADEDQAQNIPKRGLRVQGLSSGSEKEEDGIDIQKKERKFKALAERKVYIDAPSLAKV